MDENQKNSLSYFKNALELDRLKNVEYSQNTGSFWTISAAQIEDGQLDDERTSEIFQTYFRKISASEKKQKEINTIDLLISLRAVSKGTRVFGVLNSVCSLSKTGELSVDPSDGGPWIPNDRLATENSESMDIMVGDLNDFWKFSREQKEELESKIETWSDYLSYANKLFSFVNKNPHESLEGSSEKYVKDTVYLTLGDNIFASGAIISLYDYLLKKDQLPATISAVLTPTNEKESDRFIDENGWMAKNMSASCGSMSKAFPLATSQRKAVHAYTRTKAGDVLAVSGPPGTGKTTMLQAIVANLITTHALQGKKAPVIVGSSTNNQAVTNIIDSFSSVASDQHGPLDFRWLLKSVEKEGVPNEESTSFETLPGIAAYCPSKSRLAEARKSYLVEQTDKSGVYSEYSNEAYLDYANKAFFAYTKQLTGREVSSFKHVQEWLHTTLAGLENAKNRLINSACMLIKQVDMINCVESLDEQYRIAKTNQLKAQENLRRWMTIDKERPRTRFLRKPASSDEDLIYANKNESDSFPNTLDSITHVKEYYKQIMNQQGERASTIQQNRSDYDKAKRNYHNAFDSVVVLLESSMKDEDIVNQFKKFDPQNEGALLELDKILDTTVRYAEFWLSVHYFESQWLMDCTSQDNLIPKENRWQDKEESQKKYWQQVASLTPCLVMTEYQLPKYFTLYGGKEKSKEYDLGRIDLLIVDEAGQVNSPVALASFALAKQAVVVGDIQQLSPVWSLTPEADKEIAEDNGVSSDNWDERSNCGLTSSRPSSLMRAAANACAWFHHDEEAGLFLEEHYRCVEGIIKLSNKLLYKERLVPSRVKESKIEKLIDPFIFHVVPGSKDKKVGSSRKNEVEAVAIVEWLKVNSDSLEKIYGMKIDKIVGIVTPFAAQAQLIKTTLSQYDQKLAQTMTIGTAHKLQGAERAVILFSAVYGDESGDAGFIERTPELTNVAVSRAKDLFIVFGSKKRLDDSGKVLQAINAVATVDDGNLPEVLNKNQTDEIKDEPTGADTPAIQSALSFDGEKGISKLLSFWIEHGVFANKKPPSAKDLNQSLKAANLIASPNTGDSRGWMVTARGRELGIHEIPPDDKRNYYMCQYDKDAANRILPFILAQAQTASSPE